MWKGRFQKSTSDLVKRFGESVSFDWRLYAQDIRGSVAHAEALARAGIITGSELRQIKSGLKEIEKEIREGRFTWKRALEDVHMNIESALTDRIGPAGAKLHTARSRNDQIATDMRLYCRDESRSGRRAHSRPAAGAGWVRRRERTRWSCLATPISSAASRCSSPITCSHMSKCSNAMPAGSTTPRAGSMCCRSGSGALAGSTIVLDRTLLAGQLGFDEVSRNSMDAVSDRDFVAELFFAIALCGVHLSRLAEDIILWVERRVRVRHARRCAHHRIEPDAAEEESRCGRTDARQIRPPRSATWSPADHAQGTADDLQPRPAGGQGTALRFARHDQARARSLRRDVRAMEINRACRQAAASDPFLLATDLADYLVKKGVAFRQAHEIIGKLTAFSLAQKRGFPELSLEEFRQFSELFDRDLFAVLDTKSALKARQATGPHRSSMSPRN